MVHFTQARKENPVSSYCQQSINGINYQKKTAFLITLLMLAAIVPLVGTGTTESGNQDGNTDTDLNYTYGAYLEPPEDRILHGIGQWNNGNANFLAALDNLSATAQLPASELTFLTLDDDEDDIRGWNWSLNALTENLANGEFEGRIPSLSLALRGEHLSGDDYYEGYGIDELVATTDEYDYRIQEYIDMVMDYDQPVFLRIGGEFSGFWNGYEPVMYPLAFRKIVQMFRDSGADNVAFVWCYEPAAPGNFAEVDHDGNYLWFPGNDVIDWYGIDVFHTNEFSGGGVKHDRTEAFLEMALDAGKPVVVAESTARDTIITNDSEMATSYWDEWFDLFFTWLNDHEQIKAFHYINVDWTVLGHYGEAGWGQADITVNPALMQMFLDEISGEQYMHLGEIEDLNGYNGTNGAQSGDETITVNHVVLVDTPPHPEWEWNYSYQIEVNDLQMDTQPYTAIILVKRVGDHEWGGLDWWWDINDEFGGYDNQFNFTISLQRGCYFINASLYESDDLHSDEENATVLVAADLDFVVGTGTCVGGVYSEDVEDPGTQDDGGDSTDDTSPPDSASDDVGDEGGGLPGFSLLLTLVSLVGALAVTKRRMDVH